MENRARSFLVSQFVSRRFPIIGGKSRRHFSEWSVFFEEVSDWWLVVPELFWLVNVSTEVSDWWKIVPEFF